MYSVRRADCFSTFGELFVRVMSQLYRSSFTHPRVRMFELYKSLPPAPLEIDHKSQNTLSLSIFESRISSDCVALWNIWKRNSFFKKVTYQFSNHVLLIANFLCFSFERRICCLKRPKIRWTKTCQRKYVLLKDRAWSYILTGDIEVFRNVSLLCAKQFKIS